MFQFLYLPLIGKFFRHSGYCLFVQDRLSIVLQRSVNTEHRRKPYRQMDIGSVLSGGTGYYDRIGVYEIMEITPTLRSMIAKRCSADELRQAAISEGMHTMRESAKRLVLEGITSLSELQRISMEDQNEVQDEFVVHGLSSEVSA